MTDFFGKFSKSKLPQIRVLVQWESSEDRFAPGFLIQVKNGTGDLYEKFLSEGSPKSYETLMFRGIPLFQLQGDEYFCPTCEKIVKSAYQLEQTEEFHVEALNRNDVGVGEVFKELEPLLGLLEEDFYCIWDTQLYPTDGNGHLFWDYPNDDSAKKGSCVVYCGMGEWGSCIPHFTIATQSRKKWNPERTEYYRQHPGCRAVAYYMDGNLTALIDGHHKAMAAALEHQSLNAIVISRCYPGRRVTDDRGEIRFLCANDTYFNCENIGECKIAENRTEHVGGEKEGELKVSDEACQFPPEIKKLAEYYPTAEDCAYIDICGTITDQTIEEYMTGKKEFVPEEICIFIRALGAAKHKRLFEVLDCILHSEWYRNPEVMVCAVQQLVKLPRTEQMEAYLIDCVVDIEEEYPMAARIILDNL